MSVLTFHSSSEHSEIFISVFYPNWLIIRKFYLNLLIIPFRRPSDAKGKQKEKQEKDKGKEENKPIQQDKL